MVYGGSSTTIILMGMMMWTEWTPHIMHTSRMAVGNRVQYNVNGDDIYGQEGLDHNVLMDTLGSACASFGWRW